MTVRLRAHHLLCMLTYVGKGYSPAFVENYEAIAARLSAGEEIEMVAGPERDREAAAVEPLIFAVVLPSPKPHLLQISQR